MFCPKCGNQLADNVKFCNKCGHQMPVKEQIDSASGDNFKQSNPASTQVVEPIAQNQYSQNNIPQNRDFISSNSSNTDTASNQGMSNGQKVGIICAICAVIIAIVVAVVIVMMANAKEAEIRINVNIDDYADTTSTGLPVVVEGEDGSFTEYINSSGNGLNLKKGDYKLNFPASPLCENGNFYKTPTDYCSVSITNNKAEIAYSGKEEVIKYSKMNIVDVTDKQINDALIYAKESDKNGDKAEKYAQNTKDARSQAIENAQKRAQEEAAAAAEKAKADKKAKAATQFVSGKYVNINNSAITMQLNLESKKAIFYKNGALYATANLLEKSQMRQGMSNAYTGNWWVDMCGIDVFSESKTNPTMFGGTGLLELKNGVLSVGLWYQLYVSSAGEGVSGDYSFVE